MKALLVVESYFGNTQMVAEAVAAGLAEKGVEVTVADIPSVIPADTDLLLIAVPTHMRGLPSAASRKTAADKGGAAITDGVKEWLPAVELPQGIEVAVFDTVSGSGWMAGSAAKAVAKVIKKRYPEVPLKLHSFQVSDMKGPLASGQLEQAREWGQQLA